jgi:hypothetical protein
MFTERCLSFLISRHSDILQHTILEPSFQLFDVFTMIFLADEGSVTALLWFGRLAFLVAEIEAFDVTVWMGHDLHLFYLAEEGVVVPFEALWVGLAFREGFWVFAC